MGSTDENTLANSSASKRSTTDKRITIPSTENIKLELDESFNVSATLKRQSKPIVSLDLLDDLEISTEFSHRIRGFAPRTGRPLFCMKSAVPGIFALGGDLALFMHFSNPDTLPIPLCSLMNDKSIW